MSLAPISESSLKDQAYTYLKTLISRVPASQGRFITEREIADELSMSRTPVREAFRNLEMERLLESVPNKGAWIPPLTSERMRAVLEARIVIEVFCAHRLAHRGADELAHLGALLTEQRNHCNDPGAFLLIDRRFHSAIVETAEQEVFSHFYGSIEDWQLRMGAGAVESNEERMAQVLAEHQQILDSILAKDPEAIRRSIEMHIENTHLALRLSGPRSLLGSVGMSGLDELGRGQRRAAS
jgi:Transcriptional regulators